MKEGKFIQGVTKLQDFFKVGPSTETTNVLYHFVSPTIAQNLSYKTESNGLSTKQKVF